MNKLLTGKNGAKQSFSSRLKAMHSQIVVNKNKEVAEKLAKKSHDTALEVQQTHIRENQKITSASLDSIYYISKGLIHNGMDENTLDTPKVPLALKNLPPSLVKSTFAYYPLEKDAKDYSGHKYDGSPSGALKFVDGYPDFSVAKAEIKLPAMREFTNNYGISCWIWIDEDRGDDGRLAIIAGNLMVHGSVGLYLYFSYNNTFIDVPLPSNKIRLPAKQWNNLVLTYDHGDREVSIYLNAKKLFSQTMNIKETDQPRFPADGSNTYRNGKIGGALSNSSVDNNLNGRLADVYFFDKTPSQEEVSCLAESSPKRNKNNISPYSFKNVIDFCYDSDNKMLYFVRSGQTNSIQAANSNGTELKSILESAEALSNIVIDGINKKLFCIRGQTEIIQIDLADNNKLTSLLKLPAQRTLSPKCLSLNATSKTLYWSSDGIWSASYDGSEVQNVVSMLDAPDPIGLVISRINGKLFWLDKKLKNIRSCSNKGNAIKDILSIDDPITGLAIDEFESTDKDGKKLTNQTLYWLSAKGPRLAVAEDGVNAPWLMCLKLNGKGDVHVVKQLPVDSSFTVVSKQELANEQRMAASLILQQNQLTAANEKQKALKDSDSTIADAHDKYNTKFATLHGNLDTAKQDHIAAKKRNASQLNDAKAKKIRAISKAKVVAASRYTQAKQQSTTMREQANNKASGDKARARSAKAAAQRQVDSYHK